MAADATTERALASAIHNTAGAGAGAGDDDDDASVFWLVPCRPRLFQQDHPHQDPAASSSSAAQVIAGAAAARGEDDDDDVACLLDEISPPVSDLDELVIERPMLLGVAMVRALGATSHEATILASEIFGLGEEGEAYRGGGFGAVPASAAAVARLKKTTFRAGGGGDGCSAGVVTGCTICLEDFDGGEEVTVMPCGGHEFHPDCIAKWLGHSNMCPLCRHPLPTSTNYVDDSETEGCP